MYYMHVTNGCSTLQLQQSWLCLRSFIQSPGLTSICSIFITHLSLRAPSMNSSSDSSPILQSISVVLSRTEHIRTYISTPQSHYTKHVHCPCKSSLKLIKLSENSYEHSPSPFSSTSSNIRSTTWSGVRRLHSSSSSPWQAFFSR